MKKQKYRSYNQIEQDLEILKLEKEISYQKIIQSFEHTKENLEPKNLLGLSNAPKAALNLLGGLTGPVKGAILSFVIKKIFK